MNRAAVVAIAAALVACGGKKDAAPASGSGSSAGNGSAVAAPSDAASAVPLKVVPLAWANPDGTPLLALHDDGGLDGPCGPVGKLAGGSVVIGETTLVWTGVDRKETPDRKSAKYQVAPLPWTIEVDEAGAVQLEAPGKPPVALGKVTGTDSEDGKTLFAALVVAAPTLTVKLAFAPADGKPALELVGSADLAAYTIKQGGAEVSVKKRGDAETPPPPFEEATDGTVKLGGAVAGKLVGRAKCAPHDKAAAALIHAYRAR